jgi:hypothetical protein
MRQDLKRLLRSDLLSFARKALTETSGETMPEDRYLELLAGRLADLVTGDSKRLIVNLPPRHFKTWMGSICLSAWILGHHPSAERIAKCSISSPIHITGSAGQRLSRLAWRGRLLGECRSVEIQARLISCNRVGKRFDLRDSFRERQRDVRGIRMSPKAPDKP